MSPGWGCGQKVGFRQNARNHTGARLSFAGRERGHGGVTWLLRGEARTAASGFTLWGPRWSPPRVAVVPRPAAGRDGISPSGFVPDGSRARPRDCRCPRRRGIAALPGRPCEALRFPPPLLRGCVFGKIRHGISLFGRPRANGPAPSQNPRRTNLSSTYVGGAYCQSR